ncbi:hypothetical protein BOTCAL_0234g00170 [Botryotinia calthae]|uniref:Uncharacterized protein n=1 Tax=Botryotinia calthae TaxID=38488 RepID=A0A4Y8CY36_9HELO|nr:hypothetical protein BOTCAL_0234g00170 [Botryotinia calthae]
MPHPTEQTAQAQAQFHHASETYKNAACKLQEMMLEAGGLRKFLIDTKYQEIVLLYRKLQELLKSHYFPECVECGFGMECRVWDTTGEGLFSGELECLRVLLELESRRRVCRAGEGGDGEEENGEEQNGDSYVVESGKLIYALQSSLQGLKELKGGEMLASGVGKEDWAGGLIDTFAALEKIRRGARKILGSERGSQDFEELREEFQRLLVTLAIHFDFIILETIDNPTICQQVDPAKELRNRKPKVYMELLVESHENLGLGVLARLKAIRCCIDELSQSRFRDVDFEIVEE